MQDDKFNEIAEEYSIDNELTDKYAGFKENSIRSKSWHGLEEKCACAEDDCGQKEETEQGVEFYQELIGSKKRRLDRTSDSNQTSPKSQEEINDQDRNFGDFKDEAYWENYNGKEVTLEGQVPWSCDGVEVEMPYATDNMIIARYKATSKNYDPSWTQPRFCFIPVTNSCIPAKVKKAIMEERKILARINRIEDGISALSKQISRLEKIKKPYLQQSGRQGQNTGECSCDYYDDETECDFEDKYEESSENCLESLASKLSGLRCRFCRSDKKYLKLDSSLEDLCKSFSPSEEQYIPENKTGKGIVDTQDDEVDTEEDLEFLKEEEESPGENSEQIEVTTEESAGKKKDETKSENNEESKVKENNQDETEKTLVTKNEELTMNQDTKSKSSNNNNNNNKQKSEIAANYSEEYVPYMIKKPDGVPRSEEKKSKTQSGESGKKKGLTKRKKT